MLRFISVIILFAALLSPAVCAQSGSVQTAPPATAATRVGTVPDYEGWTITAVEVVAENVSQRDSTVEAEIRALLTVEPNNQYSLARVHNSLNTLFASGRVSNARVEAVEAGPRRVLLRYFVRPQARVTDVVFDIVRPTATPAAPAAPGAVADSPITEDELRARINLLEPGTRVSEQTLRASADAIQVYLRDRGYYRAVVEFTTQLDSSGTRSTVAYRVLLGEQARVDAFNINVDGFAREAVAGELTLRPDAPFTRAALGEDVNRIRQAIIAQDRLAPRLNDPQVVFDTASNRVTINLSGAVGPKVDVNISGYEDLDEDDARELLPVLREGSVDASVIVEGQRRLRNRAQQEGYFFAEVNAICSVQPPFENAPASTPERPAELCANVNPEELTDRSLRITYNVDLGRRFKLTDIRIEGTNKIILENIEDDLRTQRATALGFIPLLGYGRGYTSAELLEQDRNTINARMRDLGYRKVETTVRQGVSLDGENLIITFDVVEGPLTRLTDVDARGNQLFTDERLRDARCRNLTIDDPGCLILGGPYSGSIARSDGERIRRFYADEGYVGTTITLDVVELPPAANGDEQVRLIYTVDEGDKVYLNRIVVNGNVRTSREAIIDSIPLKEGELLRAGSLRESERILFASGAFRQVTIRPERLQGETPAGYRRADIVIEVEEQQQRDLTYGFGFSTDNGPLGLIELRNSNLFGNLQQGSVRLRVSQRRQLARIDFFNPRFQSVGEPRRFLPLRLSAQYQRDTNVTRFFRSTIDRGNFGIVQRLDAEGNPIDQFGEPAGEPTVNRFTVAAETQRVIDERSRSAVFLRYSYEDVRLFKIESLLIADLLRPDRVVRLSSFGASFARDTRDRATDAARGEFFTVDYAISLRELGGNISFSKFQSTYRRYYRLGFLRNTVLAGGASVGLSSVIRPRDRDANGVVDDVDRSLPISERFFTGGSNTLRGFGYEEAGPRAFVQGGTFFNDDGEQVQLAPYTVPIGGNALAIVNVEARVPITKNIQVVPFYDGGNVFYRTRDIFRREARPGEDPNRSARWTHTVGLGLRFKTPFGPLGVDYGFLLNRPEFVLPPGQGGPATSTPKSGQFHFRFGQSF